MRSKYIEAPAVKRRRKGGALREDQSRRRGGRERYIKGNLRLVLSVIKRFESSSENADDLFQIGCVGLMKAVDHFDPTRLVKFSTYAVPMIIGEIRRYLRDNSPMRVSRSLRDTAYKAIYAKEGYIRQHMKEPTVQEIADEIGISKEDVVYALDAIQMPVSLHEPVYSDGGDTLYVMDQVSDKKNKEENWVEELSLEAAMERLNERERYIITLRFFEGEDADGSGGADQYLSGAGEPPGEKCPEDHEKVSSRGLKLSEDKKRIIQKSLQKKRQTKGRAIQWTIKHAYLTWTGL